MDENLSTANAFAARYGPWALVLGGSEGIGECFAHRIAAEGVNVVLVARRSEPLEATAAAVRAAHRVEVRTVSVDL
ncbi:MAG: SDR family NAD(P)-dependent oxidoreductase, partial [Acidimicrobiia bacterium]